MIFIGEKIIDMMFNRMVRGRTHDPGEIRELEAAVQGPSAGITNPAAALDIACILIETLRERNVIPDDCALTYHALGLVRYLRGKLPPGDKTWERWKHLETPLKINYTLSDRARYNPWIARVAGELREMMRGLVIEDSELAFSVLNYLRQAVLEMELVTPDSLPHRCYLALLDYLERDGAPADPGQPSYANGGRVPRRSTFEVRLVTHEEEAEW